MPKRAEVAVALDWSAADVCDARLVLPYAEKTSKCWVQEAASVLEHLGADGRSVEIGREAVNVSDVVPGGEEELRHLLESVVLEVNARLAPDEHDQRERSPEDTAMTAAFRSFAPDRDPGARLSGTPAS